MQDHGAHRTSFIEKLVFVSASSNEGIHPFHPKFCFAGSASMNMHVGALRTM